MNKSVKKLYDEFGKTVDKRLKNIKNGKADDLISISFEIMVKNQFCEVIENYHKLLSKDELNTIKKTNNILKKMYKVFLESEPKPSDYKGVDIEYVSYVLRKIKKG